ncbi:MAG: NAD/NADP octopine/nopaline dehydrogenase family protein [Chloroflexota bacterium]|nr:NAD/NADP octopine/nopaline dehydrogenase family protein [Chloroflexota bacterium]
MSFRAIRYTVVGAGNGGRAMAAHLALMGFEVVLYNRTPKHVKAIKARGGITLESKKFGPSGFGKLARVTSNIKDALDGSHVIMVVVPANAHKDIARSVVPYLQDGQIVILNPGRTLGALEFRKVLDEQGCKAKVIVAETQTLIYASRAEGPAQAFIFSVKDAVPLAALPYEDTSDVLEAINSAYPQFIDDGDMLHTSLNNIGSIFHPSISLLNASWIEARGGNFEFYLDGVTPTVALIMEAIDRERVEVASALGIQVITAREWLKIAYNASGKNLYEAIHNQSGYRGINAPPTLRHRYITEDIPMSLVPIASLGHRFGVSVRGMESIIRLACIAHQVDYWQVGRTVKNLGIENLSVSELLNFARYGNVEGRADD